jgi:hypothetical protein
VQNIGQSMSTGQRVGATQGFGSLMHGGPIHWRCGEKTCIQINLEVVQHLKSFCPGEAFASVVEVQVDLQAHGLPELQQEQAGNSQCAIHSGHVLVRLRGIDLCSI